MTLRDFNRLSEAGKDETVELKGSLLEETTIPGYKVALYKVDNFFVEVYYDLKRGVVHRFKGCVRSDLIYS